MSSSESQRRHQAGEAPAVQMEEAMIPAADDGLRLYLRRKRQAGAAAGPPVLLVHGATYPAHCTIDFPFAGLSWLDHLACQGFDAYALDLRGYGRSDRPPEMDQPAMANPPIVDTDTAARDVAAAMAHIRARTGLAQVALVGWSWGCAVTALAATRAPEEVSRLVLHAPQWLRDTPSPISAGDGPLGAYRLVSQQAAKDRWLAGVPEARRADWLPPGWFEGWAEATWASDPQAGHHGAEPLLRAPNGVIADSRRYWLAGRPLYDPARLTMPVLVIVGEWDVDTPPALGLALFRELVSAAERRYVLLGEATHFVLKEPGRRALFGEVDLFLSPPS